MIDNQLSLFDEEESRLYYSIIHNFPGLKEGNDLEYKSAQGGFPNDFWETYSAFANSFGGFIILGVSERKGVFTVEGLTIDKIESYKKTFWDNVNNPNKVRINLLNEKDVKQIEYENKTVLLFKIPAASRTQKPVHLTRNPFDYTFKRNNEGDYKCTKEEVRRMLADADVHSHHDSRILEGYSIQDIDLDSLNKYRQLFATTKSTHPWLALKDIDFLEKLGGYRKDRTTKKEGFTLAGLLMFGKGVTIPDPECAPSFFPDYRETTNASQEVRWTDRIYPDGTWEANLFQFYLKIWPKLSSSLPKPFQIRKGIRQDETPAHIALREAFVNTLIHTDYTAPGNIVIEHSADAFVFSNPGTLLVSLEQYYNGGISECRNPNLQKMFLMIGSAEKAGSGVNKILAGWDYAHWRRPYLKINNQPDRIILALPMSSILPEETLHALRQMFGDEIDTLGKNELTILATCHIEGEISNSRLQYLIDLHRTDITATLQDLCKKGYLVSEYKGRWTTYHLIENTAFNKNSIIESENEETSSAKVDTSDFKVDTSGSKVDTSGAKVDTSGANMENSIFTGVTSTYKMDIVSEEDTRRRLPKAVLEERIIEACKDRFLTLEEISTKVNKDVKYLKNKVIRRLIDKNVLERLYPSINHPNQAYKTKG